VPPYTPAPAAEGNHLAISFWYSGQDRLSITVVRPDGTEVTAGYGEVRQGASPRGGIYIDNASRGPNPSNGDHEAYIAVEDLAGSGPPQAGAWQIRVAAQQLGAAAPYHFWIFAATFNATGTGAGFTNSHLVGSPGTARQAVTVGAYVSRLRWTSVDGNSYGFTVPNEEVGDIAQFSSVGPTRDGRLKPEITAPGRVVISSLSRHADLPTALIVPGSRHFALQGSSMAAPIVAGGVALLLQRAPSLSPAEVKQILAGSSIRDNFTQRSYVPGDPGGLPNFTWGFGKLDIEAGIAAAADFAVVSVLGVAVTPLELPEAPITRRGTRVPLLRVDLSVDGPEAVDVGALGFGLLGIDPAARLLLFRDLDGDGRIGPQDPQLAEQPVSLQPGDTARTVVPLALRIPARQSVTLLAALEFSGQTPHRSPLQAWFRPAETRAVGVTTGQPSRLRQPADPVRTQPVQTTLLEAGELFALSENPVRASQLIFNFREVPGLARIYTATGREVVDLIPRLDGGLRIVWDLTNDRGAPVAPGVYLAVFRIGGETVRERLIIARPAAGREE
jgi:hypothetical protein